MNYRNKGMSTKQLSQAVMQSAHQVENTDCKFLCPLKKELQKIQSHCKIESKNPCLINSKAIEYFVTYRICCLLRKEKIVKLQEECKFKIS
jgi:hypothetical protein